MLPRPCGGTLPTNTSVVSHPHTIGSPGGWFENAGLKLFHMESEDGTSFHDNHQVVDASTRQKIVDDVSVQVGWLPILHSALPELAEGVKERAGLGDEGMDAQTRSKATSVHSLAASSSGAPLVETEGLGPRSREGQITIAGDRRGERYPLVESPTRLGTRTRRRCRSPSRGLAGRSDRLV